MQVYSFAERHVDLIRSSLDPLSERSCERRPTRPVLGDNGCVSPSAPPKPTHVSNAVRPSLRSHPSSKRSPRNVLPTVGRPAAILEPIAMVAL